MFPVYLVKFPTITFYNKTYNSFFYRTGGFEIVSLQYFGIINWYLSDVYVWGQIKPNT